MLFRKRMKTRLGVTALIAAATMAPAVVFDGPNFYERPGVRDYDQRRNVLPGDGSMYCVPTSYVDMFKYLAAAGLTNIDASFGGSYSDATSFIFTLGLLMGTGTTSGTNSETAFDVGSSWIHAHTGTLINNWFFGPDWDWGVGTIKNTVASGSIDVIGYGRYHFNSNHDEWERNGGHCVALAGYDYTSSTKKIIVSDPNSTSNDPNGINGQGDFTHDYHDTSNISFHTADYGYITHARYTFYTGDYGNDRRVIDSMHQIQPVWAGWFETTVHTSVNEGSAGDGSVKTIVPFQFEGGNFQPHEVQPREEMVDWVYDLGLGAMFYVTKLGRIYYVDLTTGEDKLIHVVKGATALMVGGSTNDLYVLVHGDNADSIMCFERNDMHLEQNQAPDGIRHVTKTLPGHGLALEYDPVTGGAAVLSSGLDKAWSFDEGLGPKPDLTVPPLEPGSGKVLFKIDHISGDVIMARDGDRHYWRAPRGSGETLRHAVRTTHGITAIVPTENNCLLIQDGDVLQTYDRNGEVVETQFSNVVVGGPVKLSRSHFAGKRGTLVGPRWRNLTEEELNH
jgi:hypothetical protein